MVIGAVVTMAFFFAYTQVRTATQNVSRILFLHLFVWMGVVRVGLVGLTNIRLLLHA